MSNYYQKEEAKVNIGKVLFEKGWKVFGYKEDQSDSMIDYYSPARWEGIAEKNGFVLVVDLKHNGNSGKVKTIRSNITNNNLNKIEKLSKMTQENGCTSAEEENAKQLLNKLKESNKNNYVVDFVYPEFMANPKGYIWHIEKDGNIITKGRTLTTFASIPNLEIYDIEKEEYKEEYKYFINYDNEKIERKTTERENKAIKAFKNFIEKIESTVAIKIGEGEEEKLIKVIEEKKTIKLEKEIINRKDELKIGDIIYINSSKGYVKILEVNTTFYTCIKVSSKTWKESKSKYAFVNLSKKSYDNALNSGHLKVYNIKEVEEVVKIEKWIKDNKNKKDNKKEDNKKEDIKETINNDVEKVVLNEDKNGVEIYFNNKPDEDVRNSLKNNGFRWSKYNKCWYAKQNEDTINFANSLYNKSQEEIKEESKEYKEEKEKQFQEKLKDLDINDIENYKVNDDLSKRENNISMFRNKEINHTKEIQEYFKIKQNKVLEILNTCNNKQIEYNLKMSLQKFKKDYYNNYIKQLEHRALNPSWAVTGRSGRNVNKDQKMMNKYDKLLKESSEIIERLNNSIKKCQDDIRKIEKETLKKEIEETAKNTTMPKFNKIKKEYSFMATNKIFDHSDEMEQKTMNEYQGYYIFKNWGSYHVYDSDGNDLYNTKTNEKLEDAKKWLLHYLNNKVS